MVSGSQHGAPNNVVAIFAAHFHVRNGNEIAWKSSQSARVDLSGVEWKVLPSGAHLVERDTIYFRLTPSQGPDDCRIGVACFRNRKVASDGEGESSTAGRLNQRGARMVAVGAVMTCPTNEPSSQLDATLPHLSALANFAEQLASIPAEDDASEAYRRFAAYHDKYAYVPAGKSDQRLRRMSKLPQLDSHDPILDLPALLEGLGPLLPSLIKRMLLPSIRLLIFSAPPMQSSSSLAFNLSLLVRASNPSPSRAPPLIRGIIGLHDIAALADEDRVRVTSVNSSQLRPGWIAWTSDKILMEKKDLYDVLLDLTPLSAPRISARDISTKSFSSSLPRIIVTQRVPGKLAASKPQSWTARELTAYQLKDDEARELAAQSVEEDRGESVRDHIPSEQSSRPTSLVVPTASTYNTAGTPISRMLLMLYALLRYYTGGIWMGASRRSFLTMPTRTTESSRLAGTLRGNNFILPLGIREDGGARSSLLVLGDGDGDDQRGDGESGLRRRGGANEEEEDEEDEDPLIAAAGGSRRARSRSRSRTRPARDSSLIDVQEQRDRQAGEVADDLEDEDDEEDSEQAVALAHALASVWARWGAGLVQSVENLITSRLASETVASNPPLVLSAADLATCGLSVSNALDVLLVRTLAAQVSERHGLTREVKIVRGLPVLRWFM